MYVVCSSIGDDQNNSFKIILKDTSHFPASHIAIFHEYLQYISKVTSSRIVRVDVFSLEHVGKIAKSNPGSFLNKKKY